MTSLSVFLYRFYHFWHVVIPLLCRFWTTPLWAWNGWLWFRVKVVAGVEGVSVNPGSEYGPFLVTRRSGNGITLILFPWWIGQQVVDYWCDWRTLVTCLHHITRHISCRFHFLGTFTKLRKVTFSFVLSACLSAWNNLVPTGRMFVKFDIWIFFKICQEILSFIKILKEYWVLYMKIFVHLWQYLAELFLE